MVGFSGEAGWAERRAVTTDNLAELPEFDEAAALPVAGVTALQALRARGPAVVGLDSVTEPVFGMLDNVGGKLLAQAFSLVDDGGSVQSIGMASNEPTTINFEHERRLGNQKRLEPFTVHAPFQADLQYLLTLLGRKVAGKAVLRVQR